MPCLPDNQPTARGRASASVPRRRASARRSRRRAAFAVVAALLFAACLLPALAAAPPAEAGTVLRGLGATGPFPPVSDADLLVWEEALNELRPAVVRIDLAWSRLEPSRGRYDEAYIAAAAASVASFRAKGVRVLIQVWGVPEWASDKAYWRNPIPGDQGGVYRPFYPMRRDRLPDLQACMEHLSAALRGNVMGYLCWNEPNLYGWFYPQRTSTDAHFAARHYVRMLKAFAAGVRAGDPGSRVVAGETAPSGRNTKLSTSPQRFAAAVKRFGGAKHFDVYSHHPYAIGGTKRIAPEDTPATPSRTVSLSNIGTLLRIFPGKPFYLTEYGYQTAFSFLLGVHVSEPTQAAYLRRAYRRAARHSQVKMLLWWTVRDRSAGGTYADRWGSYFGLRRINGNRKPSYFVFAGGNSMTLEAPARVKRADGLTLSGAIRSRTVSEMGGAKLLVQRKTSAGWVTVKTVRSAADGSYAARVWPKAGARWRVNWQGVTTSRARWVGVGG